MTTTTTTTIIIIIIIITIIIIKSSVRLRTWSRCRFGDARAILVGSIVSVRVDLLLTPHNAVCFFKLFVSNHNNNNNNHNKNKNV